MELFRIGFVSLRVVDVLDITIVAALLYQLHKLFRRTVIIQGVGFMLGVLVIFALAEFLKMTLLRTILQESFQLAVFALVVVFAPEIRRILLNLTRNTLLDKFRSWLSPNLQLENDFEEIIKAVYTLASTRTGALIVLARNADLHNINETGDLLNATVSHRLIESIFHPKSPLHDGAVIIRGNKIEAARCVLPVSDDPDLPPELGLRHRSALGVTEVTDAVSIIVSEETGKVSIAAAGRLKRNLSPEELRQFLTSLFKGDLNTLI